MNDNAKWYYIEKLKALERDAPSSASHEEADDILCEILEADGHTEIVAAYREIEKWYS